MKIYRIIRNTIWGILAAHFVGGVLFLVYLGFTGMSENLGFWKTAWIWLMGACLIVGVILLMANDDIERKNRNAQDY